MVNKLFLCEFHRPEYKIATLADLVFALLGTFNKQKINTYYLQNSCSKEGVNIIFGAHRLFKDGARVNPFPPNSIIFNLEPLYEYSEVPSHLHYLEALQQWPVIDYSPNNMELLSKIGNGQAYRFKFGYLPLANFSPPPKSERFLFYGILSDRRKLILQTLVDRKVNVTGYQALWGFERDYEILNSKAVLNISKTSQSYLEIYRLWHSLCLDTAVISERGLDPVLCSEWSQFVRFTDDMLSLTLSNTTDLVPASLYRERTSFGASCESLLHWIDSNFN